MKQENNNESNANNEAKHIHKFKNKNEKLAFEIYQVLGPLTNIVNFTNCMTRLRINLKQINEEQVEKLKEIEGALNVFLVENQVQITIGTNVTKVNIELQKIIKNEQNKLHDQPINNETNLNVEQSTNIKEIAITNKQAIRNRRKTKLHQFLVKFASIFQPFILGVVGAGLLAAIAAIITTIFNNDLGDNPVASSWVSFLYISISIFMAVFVIGIGWKTATTFGGSGIFGAMGAAIFVTSIGGIMSSVIFQVGDKQFIDQTINGTTITVQYQLTYSFLGIYDFHYIIEGTREIPPIISDPTLTNWNWEIIDTPGFFASWMIRGFHPSVVAEGPADSLIISFNSPMGSIFGALLIGYTSSQLEKLIRYRMPSAIDILVSSFIITLSLLTINLVLIIPVAGLLFVTIGYIASSIILFPLGIGAGILAGIDLITVMLGIHLLFTPIGPTLYAMPDQGGLGINVLSLSNTLATAALVGACLAVFFKAKKDSITRKQISGGLLIGVFGIIEPLLYGSALPKLKPLITACIGAAIAAMFFGTINWISIGITNGTWFNIHNIDSGAYYDFGWVVGYNGPIGGTDGVLAIPFASTGAAWNGTEYAQTNHIVYAMIMFTISLIVAYVVSFGITWYFGCKNIDLS